MIDSELKMNQIELEISNPCNERCIHCYRLCEHTKKGFLTYTQAESVLIQAKELGANSVTLTGGEALLNPEWMKICSVAEKLDFKIYLFTNGSLITEEIADFLSSLKLLKEVQLSLYSLNPDTHDSITKLTGSFSKTFNGIKLLRDRNIPIFISCPCMKENKDDIPKLISWCDGENIPNCSDLFIFPPSDYSGSNANHQLSEEDIVDFFDKTMSDNGALSYIWGEKRKDKIDDLQFYGGATNSLCVSGDGSIYPMIGWYEPLGNINTDSLKDVFENNILLKKIRNIKVFDIPACKECKISSYCNFCPLPHICANHGQLYKVDESFCNFIKLKQNFIIKRDNMYGKKNFNG